MRTSANGRRGSSKTKRCGSTARRRCWRGSRGWLRNEHVLAPADSVLRRAVGAARHKGRALLTQTYGGAAVGSNNGLS